MAEDANDIALSGKRTSSTLQDLAARHKVSLPYLYGQIRAGNLAIHKHGRATRVTDEDEAAWLAKLRR